MRSKRPVSEYDCDEMEGYTDGYSEFVLEQLTQAKLECRDPLVLIEQRLDFSDYVPEGFGTGDCLIVADKLLHIIDFKLRARRSGGCREQSPDDALRFGRAPAVRFPLRHFEGGDVHLPAAPGERIHLDNFGGGVERVGEEHPQAQSGTGLQGAVSK